MQRQIAPACVYGAGAGGGAHFLVERFLIPTSRFKQAVHTIGIIVHQRKGYEGSTAVRAECEPLGGNAHGGCLLTDGHQAPAWTCARGLRACVQLLEACIRDAVKVDAAAGRASVQGSGLGPGHAAALTDVLAAADVLGLRDDLTRMLAGEQTDVGAQAAPAATLRILAMHDHAGRSHPPAGPGSSMLGMGLQPLGWGFLIPCIEPRRCLSSGVISLAGMRGACARGYLILFCCMRPGHLALLPRADTLLAGVVVPLLSAPCLVRLASSAPSGGGAEPAAEPDVGVLTWRQGEGEAPGHRLQNLLRALAKHLFNFQEEEIKVSS